MNYEIKIERKALKFINRQPPDQKRRIMSAINKLPGQGDRRSLKGAKGLFRLRVGDYRLVYFVNNGQLIVYVIDADNRGDVYKRY